RAGPGRPDRARVEPPPGRRGADVHANRRDQERQARGRGYDRRPSGGGDAQGSGDACGQGPRRARKGRRGRQRGGARRWIVQHQGRPRAHGRDQRAPGEGGHCRHRAAPRRAIAHRRLHGADRHGGRPLMLAAFRGELFKVARRPAVWVCVVALILLAVAFSYVLLGLVYSHPPKGSNQNLPPGTTLSIFLVTLYPINFVKETLSTWAGLGGVFALIIGVLVQGSEFGWGTVKTLYTQRSGRLAMLTGKLG